MRERNSFARDVVRYFDRHSSSRMSIVDGSPFHSLGYYTKKCDVIALVREHAATLASPAICDVGCNDGTFLEALVSAGFGASYCGIDISRKALALARKRSSLQNVLLACSDGVTIPLGDATQSVVTVVEVIEHVDDKKRFLLEIFRVLRPGGICIITTPNPDCISLKVQNCVVQLLKALCGSDEHKDQFVKSGELVNLCADVGFLPPVLSQLYWIRPYISLSYYRFTIGLLLPALLPLRSSWLYALQKWINITFGRFHKNGIVTRRLCWSTFLVLRK